MKVKQLFSSSGVFDGLVGVLVQELRSKAIRQHLCVKEARQHVIESIVR